jgi:WD40 repeat protein
MLHRRLPPGLITLLAAIALTSIGGEAAQAQSKADPNGDPLPAGALARLGTQRWRQGEAVAYVAYAADNTLLTAGIDGVMRIWDCGTGKEVRRFHMTAALAPAMIRGANPAVMSTGRRLTNVALSEDGKILAAVLASNEVQLWNVMTCAELRKLPASPTGVSALAFTPDGRSLALRGGDRSVSFVKTGTGKELSRINARPINFGNGNVVIAGGTSGEASGMVFSRDSKVLATAEVELKMQKFASYVLFSDVKTGNEIRRVETPDGTSAIAYSPDRKRFAFASANAVYLCDADDGAEIQQMKTPTATGALVFSPDSKILAAKGRDQVVRLFDVQSGAKTRELGEPAGGPIGAFAFFAGVVSNEMRDLAFSPDGNVLAVAAGPTLRFWDVRTGKEQSMAGGHRGEVLTVLLAADGKTVLTHGVDRTIRRWDAATGKERSQFPEPRGTVYVAFAPDCRIVALANADGTIRLHDSTDGAELHRLKGHQNGAAGLAFSADGKTLASRGTIDRMVRLYDVAKGTDIGQMTFQATKQPGGGGNNFGTQGVGGQALAFSHDGKTLAANANTQLLLQNPNQPATVSITSTLHLWDVATRKEIRQIALPGGRMAVNLVFSPDDRVLACENANQTISLCEITSGKERALLGQPSLTGQRAMPPGQFVNGRGPIRLTKITTSVAFSPDGGLLVARGPDHTVRVWDVDFVKEVGLFKGHDGTVHSISIAADGKSLVSGSIDTTALVWDLAPIKREPKAPALALQPQAIEALWTDLIGDDAGKAAKSILTLASSSNESVAYLSENLKPAALPDAKKLAGWIADLNSNSFQTRSKAIAELDKLGDLALPALNKAIESNLPLETRRRIEPLIEKLTTSVLNAEQIRVVRAMQVLERIGSPEARTLLEALAQGAPGALTTREAQAALTNLAKQATARSAK